jgi:hypothetical protein
MLAHGRDLATSLRNMIVILAITNKPRRGAFRRVNAARVDLRHRSDRLRLCREMHRKMSKPGHGYLSRQAFETGAFAGIATTSDIRSIGECRFFDPPK